MSQIKLQDTNFVWLNYICNTYSECIQFEKFVLTFVVAAVTFFTRLIFFRPVKRVGNSRPLRTPVTKHVDQMRTDFFRYELPQTDFKDLR